MGAFLFRLESDSAEIARRFFGAQMNAVIVEPSGPARGVRADAAARGIAYAGSVKRHKGGHLLPEIAAMLAARGATLHVFGGGDVDLLRPLRRLPNVVVHGYYRSDALPSLLARHRIGLVLLPSIVPEAFSLTMSEAWRAGKSNGRIRGTRNSADLRPSNPASATGCHLA